MRKRKRNGSAKLDRFFRSVQTNIKKDVKPIRVAKPQLMRGPIKGIEKKIWRSDIGHYGGMFVEVPAEHWKEFRSLIPKKMFPRRVKTQNIADVRSEISETRFHKRFPKSKGIIKEVFFADRSKGLRHFDKLFYRSSVVNPLKEPSKPPLAKPNMKKVLRGWR